jgi:hypothetical protein
MTEISQEQRAEMANLRIETVQARAHPGCLRHATLICPTVGDSPEPCQLPQTLGWPPRRMLPPGV